MELDSDQIAQILPQSWPFIMIDRVVDFQKDRSLTAIKNITGNEWIFEGQCWPLAEQGSPWGPTNIFPETLLIEAAAQAALILYYLSKSKEGEKRPKYIWGKTTASFLNRACIGDQLKIVTSATRMFDKLGFMDSRLFVDTANVADIRIMYSVDKS